jgi:hypothetical protein
VGTGGLAERPHDPRPSGSEHRRIWPPLSRSISHSGTESAVRVREEQKIPSRIGSCHTNREAGAAGGAAGCLQGQGSGAIEKTIDVAVGRPVKAKGTSWYRPGAHRLLSLRTPKQDRT